MENITLGQILSAIGAITAIAVFFTAIYKWYKSHITDIFEKHKNEFLKHKLEAEKENRKIYDEINKLKEKTATLDRELQESKEERLVMLKGLLACLKGLHNDLNCNGPVTQGINEIEEYLIKRTHE